MDKRKIPNKEKYRKLKQFSGMSDAEFDEYWERKLGGISPSSDFEARIKRKTEEFANDYDLDDLKINDRETLRALIQAIIALEDYEQMLFKMRTNPDIGNLDINVLDRLGNVMTNLRKDISKLQDDLKITRRTRKSDKEASVVSYIADLKAKARQFYEQRNMYILCPKCKILLATVWTLYPAENNTVTLVCHRKLEDGNICGTKIKVSTADMLNTKNTNVEGVLPESMT